VCFVLHVIGAAPLMFSVRRHNTRLMKANIKVTKAGGWLFGVSLGCAVLVGGLTVDWAFTPLNKGVWRVSFLLFYASLFVIWGLAYLVGWVILRTRGISVVEISRENT